MTHTILAPTSPTTQLKDIRTDLISIQKAISCSICGVLKSEEFYFRCLLYMKTHAKLEERRFFKICHMPQKLRSLKWISPNWMMLRFMLFLLIINSNSKTQKVLNINNYFRRRTVRPRLFQSF